MSVEEHGDRFRGLEEAYKDYTVYDRHYEKIGKVDDLYVDEHDQPEYIGVKTGFLGMKSTLIPMQIARVNDLRKLIEVAADGDTIKEGPAFDDDEEITPDHEARISGYYGLDNSDVREGRGGYGDYYASDQPEGRTGEDLTGSVDTQYGERREESQEQPEQRTSAREPVADHPEEAAREPYSREPATDHPETRTGEPVSREPGSREPAGTDAGEQETGSLRVRKRVRSDQ